MTVTNIEKGAAVSANDESGYFEEPLASQLEAKRYAARAKRRITYDCFHAVLVDGVVICDKGHFPQPIPLLTVLRGRSTAACARCREYDNGDEPVPPEVLAGTRED